MKSPLLLRLMILCAVLIPAGLMGVPESELATIAILAGLSAQIAGMGVRMQSDPGRGDLGVLLIFAGIIGALATFGLKVVPAARHAETHRVVDQGPPPGWSR